MKKNASPSSPAKLRSMSRDLVVGLIAIVILSAGSVVGVNFLIAKNKAEKGLQREADQYLEYLSKSLAPSVWDLNWDGVIQIGNAFMASSEFSSLEIKAEGFGDDYVYANRKSGKFGSVIREGELRHQGFLIGSVRIGLSKQAYNRELRRLLFSSLMVAFAITLTMILASLVMLRRYVHQPLHKLMGVTTQIGKGNYDARIGEIKHQEIALVQDQLISMAKRVQEREENYLKLYQQAPVMLHNVDMNRKILSVNDQWLQTLGYSREEVIGVESIEFLSEESKKESRRLFTRLLKDGFLHDVEHTFICKNGDRVDGLLTAHVETDADGNSVGARIAILNITESNRMKEEKVRLEAQLHQSQKMEAIGTLTGGIAHDFNNILSSVFGFTELTQDATSENPKAQRYLNHVMTSAQRAKDLVRHLLTFSRKSDVERVRMNITPLVKEAIKFITASAPASIAIESNIQAKDSFVLVDVTQMHQVFMNLFTNAVHAMKDDGGVLKIDIDRTEVGETDLSLAKNLTPGKYLEISISDTGYGIPPNHINKIFDPFFTTKVKGEGTGLGLSVVYGIIKEMKGHIWVYSEQGKGTTFKMFLPEVSGEVTRKARQKTVEPFASEGGSILLVDDEKTIIISASEMLEGAGYNVVGASDAQSALETFQEAPEAFDLVITDLTMPGMQGTDLAAALHEIRPDLPIILCTGFGMGLDEELLASRGVKKILMKPLIMGDLYQEIEKHILRKSD